MDVTAEGDLPTLRRWLDGVENHPPALVLRVPSPGAAAARCGLCLVTLLEPAAPAGLGAKRREFRSARGMGQPAMEKFMPLRAELVVASLLAEATVLFRFNTGAGPDLLANVVRVNRSALVGLPAGLAIRPDDCAHVRRA
jgi:hypothetical protein